MINERLHGIICIDAEQELTYDKQDLVNQNLLEIIRDDIFSNF